MLFVSLLFTVSTSINGRATIRNAKDSESLLNISNILLAEFSALFDTLGPIAIIISAVIAIFLASAAVIFSFMIIYGSKGKGFAFGWKVHSLFNWEFYCGVVS